jgi:hypothetical protein
LPGGCFDVGDRSSLQQTADRFFASAAFLSAPPRSAILGKVILADRRRHTWSIRSESTNAQPTLHQTCRHRRCVAVLERVLLGCDALLRGGDRCGVRFYGLDVDRALLLRRPAFIDQRSVGPRLLQRCFGLSESRLVLRNLAIELWNRQLGKHFVRLNPIADVDAALDDIAGGASKDVRVCECGTQPRSARNSMFGLSLRLAALERVRSV